MTRPVSDLVRSPNPWTSFRSTTGMSSSPSDTSGTRRWFQIVPGAADDHFACRHNASLPESGTSSIHQQCRTWRNEYQL